ncbi:MAG TPA: 6-bladed beta-propeller [Bacteroidales bacterium]|nr:6-bladed beta-propeller [Bacteroidales bacterium]
MKSIITIIILIFGTVSCQISTRKEESKIRTFELREKPEISEIKLSDLGFVDIEYIPLETNDQSSMGRFGLRAVTDRFIVGNGFYIIKQFNAIVKFRDDGSFETRIGTLGRGPTEFQVAHDIDLDVENHKMYLVSGFQEKFNVYSESGEFVRTFKIPFHTPIQFRFDDNKILCYFENLQGNIENSYAVMDTLGEIIKNFPNKYPFTLNKTGAVGVGRENLFYQFDNRLYKKEVYSDTIYVFEDMGFKPHIVIDVGDRLLTPEARAQHDLFYLGENYMSPRHLFEFGDYIYYEYTYSFVRLKSNIRYGLIGSKTTDFQAFIDADQGLINDLDGGLNLLPETIKDNNTLISWTEAINIKKHITSDKFRNSRPKYPEKKKELEKLANSLKETDNPVLMLVRLKE